MWTRFLWPSDGIRPPNDVQYIVIEDGVTEIQSRCFGVLRSLIRVDSPNTVTNIRQAAFMYCASLQFIRFPGRVATIGDQAFSRTGLRKVQLSNSIQEIGHHAFAYCEKLTNVSLDALRPNASLNIGIFWGCTKLQNST